MAGTFPFGSEGSWKVITGKLNILDMFEYNQNKFPNDKFFGTYFFGQQNLYIKDMELAKLVLIKDADHFTDRVSFGVDIKDAKNESEIIQASFLTQLKGENWKKMRTLASPVFTSGKLKLMIPHVNKCATNLVDYFAAAAASGEVLEAKSVYGMMTLDAIATAGFGIESNSFKDPDNAFRQNALRMVRDPKYAKKTDLAKFFFLAICPKLCSALGVGFFASGTCEFFTSILRKTIENRKNTGIKRNDIIDLFMEELEKDSEDKKDINMELTIISNCIIFFFAGLDTTAQSLASIIYALMQNNDVQEKVRSEIVDVIGDNEDITSDNLKDLRYTDNVISEALRYYAIVNGLQRTCTKNYKIPESDFIIPKGMQINVAPTKSSFQGECFANPDVFDPENFAAENNPNKFGFVAFGQGPRNCIGMRYALMVLKLALVHTLRNFKVVKCEETVEQLEFEFGNNNFKGGIKFKLQTVEK